TPSQKPPAPPLTDGRAQMPSASRPTGEPFSVTTISRSMTAGPDSVPRRPAVETERIDVGDIAASVTVQRRSRLSGSAERAPSAVQPIGLAAPVSVRASAETTDGNTGEPASRAYRCPLPNTDTEAR